MAHDRNTNEKRGETMKATKTIRIEKLVGIVNSRNKFSTTDKDIRTGWNSLLEEALHKTGNYAGYGYLNAEQVPTGQLPGIADGPVTGKKIFPDESRRSYYYSKR